MGEGDTLLQAEGDHWATGVEQQRWAKATRQKRRAIAAPVKGKNWAFASAL
jgi:hypothetical protein